MGPVRRPRRPPRLLLLLHHLPEPQLLCCTSSEPLPPHLSSLSDSVTFQLTGISSADNLDTLFSSLIPLPLPASVAGRSLPLSTLFLGYLIRFRSGTDLQILDMLLGGGATA